MKNKFFYLPLLFSIIFFLLAAGQAEATSLTIASPTGGQLWAAGSTQLITWSVTNPTVSALNQPPPTIYIDLNSVSPPCQESSSASCSNTNVPYIVAENVPNNGSYSWNIPSTMAVTYQGPLTLTVGLSDSSAQATTAQFYIVPPNPYLSPQSIISPKGGEQWPIGSNQTIQWSNASSTVSEVNINLVPINLSGCSVNCSSASSTVYSIATKILNSGSYAWNINNSPSRPMIPPGQYIISISDASTGNIIGSSAGAFSLVTQNGSTSSASSTLPTIADLMPNSGSVGQIVNVIGSGFTPTGNNLEFGSNTYINNLVSSNGSSVQFTVPSYSQPCPPNTNGACPLYVSLINPGSYGVTVSNAGGASNSISFQVISGTATAAPVSPTGTTIPAAFPNGSLVIVSGSPTVYLVSSGQFVPFTNAEIFLAYGYQWSQIQNITLAQLNPQDISASFVLAPNGSIIKTNDNSTVYLVVNGQKSPIPSLNIFNRLGLNFNNLILISDQELQNYPSTAAEQ